MTLQELQAKRDEILKSIGVARVQFADRSLEFVADKQKELALIDAQIAQATEAAGTKTVRQIRVYTSKGA